MKPCARVLIPAGALALGLGIFLGFGTDQQKAGAWDVVSRPFLGPPEVVPWSPHERALLASLALDGLPPVPSDPSNRYSGNPAAAALGHRLFFDSRLSLTGTVSCSTCHKPGKAFTDGLARGRGIGTSKRNTRSLLGVARSTWQYWDGRRDSLWAQALSPVEDPAEHGLARTGFVAIVGADPGYRTAWNGVTGEIFPDFSDSGRFPPNASPLMDSAARAAWEAMAAVDRDLVNDTFAGLGKAIAAYEALLEPGPDALDGYLARVADGADGATDEFGAEAIAGLRLFIGKGRCLECHNGPLLTNNEFHNTGVLSPPGELPDRGRVDGVRLAAADVFNCLSAFSDDHTCGELRFRRTGETVIGATRTPTLRGITATAPYMHKGQVKTLAGVVEHYNLAEEAMVGHNEAKPLGLIPRESRHLVAFLETLKPGFATPRGWLQAPPPFPEGEDGGPLVASDAWARATPPGADSAAVYLRLTNRGDVDVVLTDVDSPFGSGMIHHSSEADGMARMHHVDALTVPANETVRLAPGGLHLMLTGLEAALVAGQSFELQLYGDDFEAMVVVNVRELTFVPE